MANHWHVKNEHLSEMKFAYRRELTLRLSIFTKASDGAFKIAGDVT